MFLVLLSILLSLFFVALAGYGFIKWVKRESLKTELKLALEEIDQALALTGEIPDYNVSKFKKARKRLDSIINKKGE